MNTENPSPARSAAVTGLAIAGFIALIILGIGLAVYSARFVPSAVGGLGSAATYIGSLFTPAEEPGLAVVPGATTTPTTTGTSTPAATTTPPAAATTTNPTPSVTPPPVAPQPGPESTVTYGNPRPAPYGLADLAVTITGVGFGTTPNFSGFVATSTISKTAMGAVKFRITNVGTNVSGAWSFTATVPTNPYTIRSFPGQISLNPGDSIEYVLNFTELTPGNQTISVTADPEKLIGESNEDNNMATAPITILSY